MTTPRPLWKTLSLEVGSIVFAVLLALGANAWYQHVQEQQLVRSVLANIRAELTHNTEAVEQALSYHESIADTLARVRFSEEPAGSFDLRGVWQGAQVPDFKDSAYETAVVTGTLALMEFETGSRLASLYKQQHTVEHLFERYLEALLISPGDPERTTLIVGMMAGDIVLGEQALLGSYEEMRVFLNE
ncbi:MAG: hypothetical protein AAF752_14365 [Bacteroidota bacterium]